MTAEVKENRKAWAVATRSGEYKQIRGCLQNRNGHCPLGVACEVMERRGMNIERDEHGLLMGGGAYW